MDTFRTLWCCFLLLVRQGFALPDALLYDYVNIGTSLPKLDDVSSPEIKLKVPIVFYGQVYSSIFVNSNGLLSFQTDIPVFFNIEFPLDYPVIAPFYSNIDITNTGTISYYETNNPTLLARATGNIHESFSYSEDFEASSLFIITWSSVGYHSNGKDKLNTFQVAIASNGDDSFVEFLYPENGIQWIQGTGDESGLPDARAQAGFVAADGRHYLLPGSGTDQVKNLEKWSNINLPGQWAFRIGRLDQDANVEEPDAFADVLDNGIPKTCEKGISQCHGFAKCVDYNNGFCCNCKQHYYGNGKYCVKKDAPLRVNGKVNGKINGEKLPSLDLQSYVVMLDGRAYTAISRIPESVGYDIQSLQILGGLIGWVFAKPLAEAVNGFQITGGVFNHTATVVFTNANQKVTLRHKYLGLDVFDQLRMEVDIQGELPHLPLDSRVTVAEYEEQYTLTAPNTIQSSSSRYFTYANSDGNEIAVPFTVDQSFIFDYCQFEPLSPGTTWRLKVAKNFISYEPKDQIVRFGLSNKVGPLGDVDPCTEGRATCGRNSACVVENDSYTCVCNPGYQAIYRETDQAVCEDVNECQAGLYDCDYNAQCINAIGSYSCVCNAGFEGNGRFCENARSCQTVQCPENAECVDHGLATCQCIAGFTGNGQVCTPLSSFSCHIANNCSPQGFCTINPQNNLYSCICLPGFVGDGYTCDREYIEPIVTTTVQTPDESVTQQCSFLGLCWCPAGYDKVEGSSYCSQQTTVSYEVTTPETETETEQFSCNVLQNCHRNAQCVYEISIGKYECSCNLGYEGNGYHCSERYNESCIETNICDAYATCSDNVLDPSYGRCVCSPGYVGNGKECHIAHCTSQNDCAPEEQCDYLGQSQGYQCVCRDGYLRDSEQKCVKPTGECGGATCVANAECLYDDDYQTFYCSCKSDYVGDGITECRARPIGCNIVNNCDRYATCAFDGQTALYACQCNPGFFGDGVSCHEERNCHNDPYLCDARAVCITSTENKYVCQCQPGFVGNGTICRESPAHEGNYLLLNQGKATLRIPFDASKKNLAKLTHINEFQTAVGLDIDCLAGRVYWSDISGRSIKSSAYNGSSVADFIIDDIGSPEGISVDWISRNVYWTDSTKDTIEVANLETKLRATLINNNLVNPRGIAVHPQRGKIFWTDWDRKSPKIEWANADGSGREIFLQGDSVQLPNSLVIDFETEKLCYADAGTKRIECLAIDSKYRQIIAENCTYPFGIAVTDEHVYWSDWIVKKIERVDKRTVQRLPPLDVPLGGANKLYGLVAVPERCLGLTNVCQYYKSQCPSTHICLPDGGGNRRCVCGHKIDSPDEIPSCI